MSWLDFTKVKKRGVKTFRAHNLLAGKVGVHDGEVMIGNDSLTNLTSDFIHCYGKQVKVEINVKVNL